MVYLHKKRTVKTWHSVVIMLFLHFFTQAIHAQSEVDWNLVKRGEERFLSPLYQKQNVMLSWINGSSWLFYQQTSNKGNEVILVNATNGKKELLFKNLTHFITQYKSLLSDTSITVHNFRLYSLYMLNNDPNTVYWKKSGKTFAYNKHSQKLTLSNQQIDRNFTKSVENGMNTSAHTRDSLYSMLIIYI